MLILNGLLPPERLNALHETCEHFFAPTMSHFRRGHSCVLHTFCSLFAQPSAATVLVRCAMPPPQVLSHFDHALHLPLVHGVLHFCVLQSLF